MPLDDGLPKLKLSYKSAPLVFGNPLPLWVDLDVDIVGPCGDVMTGDELVFNEELWFWELLERD